MSVIMVSPYKLWLRTTSSKLQPCKVKLKPFNLNLGSAGVTTLLQVPQAGLIVCSLIFILFTTSASAQNCAQTLRLARSTYDQGRLHELPGLLKGCLSDGFTKEEKVEGFKLLTLAYIYLEEPEKADSSMLKLLHTDSYFKLNESVDPQEFIGLYNTFRTDPVYRVGLKAGFITTQPNVASSNFANDGASSYDNKIGFQVGGFAEIPVFKRFVFMPELYFQSKSFALNNTISNNQTLSSENQSWLSLPLSLQYEFFRDKFKKDKIKIMPYVALGGQVDYLISATTTISTDRFGNIPISPKAVDMKEQLNPINVSAVLSAGAKVKAGPGFVIAEARFTYGLSNIINSSNVFANQLTVFENYSVNGIYKLNSVSFSVGYAYNIFSPKKLKKR